MDEPGSGHPFAPPIEVDTVYDNVTTVKRISDTVHKYSWVFVHGHMEQAKTYVNHIKDYIFMIPEGGFKMFMPSSGSQYYEEAKGEIPSWYMIRDRTLPFTDPTRYNHDEFYKAGDQIKDLIHKVANDFHGGDYSKVFLGGVSAGCCLSLYAALTLENVIGGLVGISGAVTPMLINKLSTATAEKRVAWKLQEKAENLQIFLFNGTADTTFTFPEVENQLQLFWSENGFRNVTFVRGEGVPHYPVSRLSFVHAQEFFLKQVNTADPCSYIITRTSDGVIKVTRDTDESIERTLIFLPGDAEFGELVVHWIRTDFFKFPVGKFRVVVPTPPIRPSPLIGRDTYQWFNILGINPDGSFQFAMDQVNSSIEYIQNLIRKEANDTHSGDFSKIYLAGISAGCAMSYAAALTLEHTIGGIVGISGFVLPSVKQQIVEASPEQRAAWKLAEKGQQLPIQIFHGGADPVLPCAMTRIELESFWQGNGFEKVQLEVEEAHAHHPPSPRGFILLQEFIRQLTI